MTKSASDNKAFSYFVLHQDDDWHQLKVLGLSVQERNERNLKKNGFVPSQDAKAAHFYIDSNIQYSPELLKHITKIVSANPNQSHKFYTTNKECIPITWQPFGLENTSQKPEEHIVKGRFLNVKNLSENHSQKEIQKKLSKDLFAEIYNNTEGWIARLINKRISFVITRLLVKTPITPNQITILNLLIGILGCLCFLSLSYVWQVFGAFLLQLNSIVDGCDGEVARLKVIYSDLGGWLDTIADDILNNVMFFCLILGFYWQLQNPLISYFGFISIGASLGVTALIYQNILSQNTNNAAHFKFTWQKETEQLPKEKSFFDGLKNILKRDFFIFIVFVFVVLNIRQYLLVFLVPIWGAFFLYLASYLYGKFNKQNLKPIVNHDNISKSHKT